MRPDPGSDERVIKEFERGIQGWLNAQCGMTADFEITVTADNVRSIESLIQELEDQRIPINPKERPATAGILARAGIDEDRIMELVSNNPVTKTDSDDDPAESNYSTEELAGLPTEKLAQLLETQTITAEEQTAALKEKSKRGEI
jgi:hypothetical protein